MRAGADRAQLRAELDAAGLNSVTDEQTNGDVFINVPDDVDGLRVDSVVARHFPRSYVAAILAVDFESTTTFAELKAKCIQLRNRLGLGLKARWE